MPSNRVRWSSSHAAERDESAGGGAGRLHAGVGWPSVPTDHIANGLVNWLESAAGICHDSVDGRRRCGFWMTVNLPSTKESG